MPQYEALSTRDEVTGSSKLLEQLRTKLPRVMREQLNPDTLAQAYFLLAMISDDECVHELHTCLQEQYQVSPTEQSPIEQAVALVAQLQKSPCNPNASFKYRLPSFLGEYPIHSQEINRKIEQFNQLIEAYHANESDQELEPAALDEAYHAVLHAIANHHMGCNPHSLWQLLKAMTPWSSAPIEEFLETSSYLLLPITNTEPTVLKEPVSLPKQPVVEINLPLSSNKSTNEKPFSENFNYKFNEAGLIESSDYLLINGFAFKPGGHADALTKQAPEFLPWKQWKGAIRRQLSQQIELPLNDEFFDWFQIVLQRLGVEFMTLQASSYECYVSPFLRQQTTLSTLNEDMILGILREQCNLGETFINDANLLIISRYLMRFLQTFQFNRGQALGIGANWGGVVNESNEAGTDAFRFNDSEWASHFRHLSLHRQGPAEAHMNATIGARYELEALLSSFDYMTQLQPSEYGNTLYSALVDNLMATMFPEPHYFENSAYVKYRRHFVLKYTDEGMPQVESFYQPDSQGTYFKTKKGDLKQTPMFRQAGSLVVESFPRDIGSGECLQSLSVANPLWPLQLQYAQASSSSIRGHTVYNPIGPDEFIPDTFYGQIIRESEHVSVPFIGVVPKNFDSHFKQVELCASFVVRMLQSSRLMTYCPTFKEYYFSILSRFLPSIECETPSLPYRMNSTIRHKWSGFDRIVHDTERSAEACQEAYFSLFKELVHSLYSLTKDDVDLHYYFVELTRSPKAFSPHNRATCERLIRELTTLKPLLTNENRENHQQYEDTLIYLGELTRFFYPSPSDETAKAVAEQARIHISPLLKKPAIKDYFAMLSQQAQANISPKVSPGLMHDALKYQRPSPEVFRDFYSRRHEDNFSSGFRGIDGEQIVTPSTREVLLDKLSKTVGAVLPLIRRNKSIFSLVTQPFSQAYIQGNQAFHSKEQYKVFWGALAGIGGFFYGTLLGANYALTSLPRAIYYGWLAPRIEQRKANHVLAISSAASNESSAHIKAMMNIRDHLLRLMATSNDHTPSTEQLIALLLQQVKKIHPSLLSSKLTTEARYTEILQATFPLDLNAWNELCEPIIQAGDDKVLQAILNQYPLQIDRVLIYALYECLTASNSQQGVPAVIKAVVDKHKLKNPQDKALAALVHYYTSNPEAKKRDIEQYRFHGTAVRKLKEQETQLRKIQTWINNALDLQWSLETLFSQFLKQYHVFLNKDTLEHIVSKLPNSIKAIVLELFSSPSDQEIKILNDYELEQPQKVFLLQCSRCYREITSQVVQQRIQELADVTKQPDQMLSIKAQEHLKLTQFKQREWQHRLLAMDAVAPIIEETKKQLALSYHADLDELVRIYENCLNGIDSSKAFNLFYSQATKILDACSIESPLRDWVNVTMNVFVNGLLDQQQAWTNTKTINNPLSHSQAVKQWLSNLMTHKNALRALLSQQMEQAPSFDHAALRCQYILHALETSQARQEPIRGTGMQKLLRIICQNTNALTATGDQQAKQVPISALCKHSITMKRALERVQEKVPDEGFVRAVDISWKGGFS
ncbi:MAG: hypothetical protein P4L79_05915 [Legionella sp.]|uniref:hypothetical protein n=1 Tax=Legionella sp. TaxID=459 RepID=UPI00284E1753|nr:hypothetical protein [Legionella sp.]